MSVDYIEADTRPVEKRANGVVYTLTVAADGTRTWRRKIRPAVTDVAEITAIVRAEIAARASEAANRERERQHGFCENCGRAIERVAYDDYSTAWVCETCDVSD